VSQKARGFPAHCATSEILYSSPEPADFRAIIIAGVFRRRRRAACAALLLPAYI